MARKRGPELVFALVGATATNLSDASKTLRHILEGEDYRVVEIRLSELITKYALDDEPLKEFEDDQIEQAMARGTAIREKIGDGNAVIRLGMRCISEERNKLTRKENEPAPRTAYILRSLKHPDEVKTLRDVYKDSVHNLCLRTEIDKAESAIRKNTNIPQAYPRDILA